MKNGNDIVITFLLSPRFRIWRHLVLFIFVFFISSSFIWYLPDDDMSEYKRFIGLFFYIFIFLGGVYLNIYVLVPKFLLKNKWLIYFIVLALLVVFVLFLIVSMQEFFYEVNKPIEDISYFTGIMNVLSAVVSFLMLFGGTSAFVLFRHWILDTQRAEELESATLQSELKMLKSQINPHFLFNTLNNANIMIDEDAEMSSQILVKLEDLLRYQINDSLQDKVYLDDDVSFLKDYLELEKTRRDYFHYSISKEGDTNNIQIPPLLFIPFVENAVKHNSDSEAASYAHLYFRVLNNKISFTCENSVPQRVVRRKGEGLGLVNIKRRLDLLYGNNYLLELENDGAKYTVHLEFKI